MSENTEEQEPFVALKQGRLTNPVVGVWIVKDLDGKTLSPQFHSATMLSKWLNENGIEIVP